MSIEQQIEKMLKDIYKCAPEECAFKNQCAICPRTEIVKALYNAGYRKADDLIAENEQLRERHAALDRQIRADARREFAEKLKNYYFNTLKGSTNSTLVAYHIDQILEDIERKEEQ